MYLGRKPQRRSPRLTLILLILIAASASFVYYVWTNEPEWSQPFEPPPTPTRTPQSYIAEAEAYYGQGQLDEAIAAYQQAVAINPHDVLPRVRLAHLLVLRERSVEALLQAQQAVLQEPSNPQALGALCRALDWEGEYGQAFDACECAIELDPNYAEAYAYLAQTYVDTGDWIPAREYAQQAVERNYQSMDAHFIRGYVLEAQGRYREAAEAYDNAIVLHPRLAPLYLGSGQNHRVLGQFQEAVDRFEKATRLDPANPAGYDQLGWTYYTEGEYSRAIDTLEQATLIGPDHTSSWGHLGVAYYVLQQYEEVVPALRQAISLAEKDYLRRARRVVILGQDTSHDPPQSIELMRADFLPLTADAGTLSADLAPVLERARIIPQPDQTCGDLIAQQLSPLSITTVGPPTIQASPEGTSLPTEEAPTTSAPFAQASGRATLNLDAGRFDLQLSGLPQPEGIPYEAQLLVWPDDKLSMGYFQPDAGGNASLTFAFKDTRSAPIDYYTLLGFSYVFLGRCDQGVPWLMASLDIDPEPSNPAWQGLAQCPEDQPAPTEESQGG